MYVPTLDAYDDDSKQQWCRDERMLVLRLGGFADWRDSVWANASEREPLGRCTRRSTGAPERLLLSSRSS